MKSKELTMLVIMSVLAVGALGAYWFAFSSLTRLQTENTTLSDSVSAIRTASARAIRARDERTTLETDEAVIVQHVVHTDDVVSFLNYVETSGDVYGAVVEVLSVSEAPDNTTVALAVQITGSFSSVMHTLGSLEYGRYPLQARTVTVDVQQDGTWKLSGSFSAPTLAP